MNKNKKSKSKALPSAKKLKPELTAMRARWNEFVESVAARARAAGFVIPPDVPAVKVAIVPPPPEKKKKVAKEVPAPKSAIERRPSFEELSAPDRFLGAAPIARPLPPQPKPEYVQPYTPQTDSVRLDFTRALRTRHNSMPVRFIGIVDSLESGNVGLAMHPDGRERVICFDDFGRAPRPGGSTVQIVNTQEKAKDDDVLGLNWHASTVAGCGVHILCFDRIGSSFPIIGMVRRPCEDTVNVWTHQGKFTSDPRGHDDDLAPGWDRGLQCGQLREPGQHWLCCDQD